MIKHITNLGLVLLLVYLSGCASIFNNGRQAIHIQSDTGVPVEVNIQSSSNRVLQRQLPTTVMESPSSFRRTVIELDDPCFRSTQIVVPRSVDNTYWLNFLNFYGFAIDFLSGSMWSLESDVVLETVPLDPNHEGCNKPLASESPIERKPIRKPFNALPRNSMFGFSVTSAYTTEDSAEDRVVFGYQFAYGRKLSEEVLINIQYQSFNRGDTDGGACFVREGCRQVITEHDSLMLSLRQYIVPQANLYAGLGIARVRLSQEDNYYWTPEYDDYEHVNTVTVYNTAYAELGWMKRVGDFRVHINGAVDFSDLKLMSADIGGREEELDRLQNREQSAELLSQLRAASSVTGVSAGLTYWF